MRKHPAPTPTNKQKRKLKKLKSKYEKAAWKLEGLYQKLERLG